jgi:alpha-glucosidase
MALAFPEERFESIADQFVLGDDIIVAPVVKKGARSRKVVLPAGEWKAENGIRYADGQTIQIDVPLERLPYFTRVP